MPPSQSKPKRWRPRWSVRTLLALVTLVCAYLACWQPTKTRGEEDVLQFSPDFFVGSSHITSPIPLVVGMDGHFLVRNVEDGKVCAMRDGYRIYYFWFFGYVTKLPYKRKIPVLSLPEPAIR